MNIATIRHKGLRRFYFDDDPRGLPAGLIEKIRDVLTALQEASSPSEVALFPGWRVHRLKGRLGGSWSVTVSGNWRIVFRFDQGQAFDVDFIDYH